MSDLQQLIQEAKQKDIAILMDLVANHTSTKHRWFQAALNDPASEYRDYYYFRRGVNGNPPNNWLSFFGESAWQKAEGDMYYLTTFAATQADLNWANPGRAERNL
jgi:glycosidase